MEHVDLLRIHRDHFLPYVRANPDLLLAMLSLLCRRLRWTSSIIEDTAFLGFAARLAKRLLILPEHHRGWEERGIVVPLSQHDLASMVGAGREAVNKQLAIWRSARIVDHQARRHRDPELRSPAGISRLHLANRVALAARGLQQ